MAVPQRGRRVHPLGGQRPQDGWGGPRPIPPAGLGSAALPPGAEGPPGLEARQARPRYQKQRQDLHFDLSDQWPPGKKPDTFCSSPVFMAPELFLGMPYTAPEVDAWSLRGVLYTMATVSLSFGGQGFWELRQRVL